MIGTIANMQKAFKVCLKNWKVVAKEQSTQAVLTVHKILCDSFKVEIEKIMDKYHEVTTKLLYA